MFVTRSSQTWTESSPGHFGAFANVPVTLLLYRYFLL